MQIHSKRVKDAVNSLILSNPLFAGILIQQKFVQDDSPDNPTFSVDGETFRYNSAFADSLSFDECKAVCAHEAMHLALLHHVRAGSRDISQWNEATDHAINLELTKQGFRLPKGALLDQAYSGKSAEEIYSTLARKPKQSPKPQNQPSQGQPGKPSPSGQPQSGQNGAPVSSPSPSGASQGQSSPSQSPQGQPGSGQPNGAPSNPCGQVCKAKGDVKIAEAKAKEQVEKAVSIARMAGNMPGSVERTIKDALAPRHNLQETLNRFFTERTARDYSFTSPNKRFAGSGLVLPSLRSRDLGRVVLAIDTSGSVSADEVSAMVAELQACLDAYSDAGLSQGLTVIYADSQVQHVETLFSGDKANPKGGGGTLFKPVFDYLDGNLDGAACLIYLTDGYASDLDAMKDVSPSFPVLWGVITDNKAFIDSPPCGEAFRLDVHA